MKPLITLLFSFLLFNNLYGNTITSIKSGDWNDPSSWSSYPIGDGDIVIIDPSHTITIPESQEIYENTYPITVEVNGVLHFEKNSALYLHINSIVKVNTGGDVAVTQQGHKQLHVGEKQYNSNDLQNIQEGYALTSGGSVPISTLPVELVTFEAESEENVSYLYWLTASEEVNEGFYVEKSLDGINYTSIGFVEGQGTTNIETEYFFDDIDFTESAYYRLKQVDFNGAFEYHKTIHVQHQTSGDRWSLKEVNIYPNPVESSLNFRGINPYEVFEYISLNNMNGEVVWYNQNTQVQKAEEQIDQLLDSLRSGIYMIIIVKDGQREAIRMVKK